jgi:hypothetical protein
MCNLPEEIYVQIEEVQRLRAKRKLLSVCLVFVCIVFGALGCGTRHVRVTGYLDTSCPSSLAPGKTIFVAQNPEADNPLLEKEVASKIGKLIEEKGYTQSSEEHADFHLFYRYGIGIGPVRTEPASHPHTVSVYDAEKQETRYETVYHWSERCVQHYAASLSIRVADSRGTRDSGDVQVGWAADTTIEDKRTDLRNTLNYLLVATFAYFGQDTGRAVGLNLKPDDPRIVRLSGTEPDIWEKLGIDKSAF